MNCIDFTHRLHQLMSSFLEEAHLSAYMKLPIIDQQSDIKTSNEVVDIALLDNFISNLQDLLNTAKENAEHRKTAKNENPELVQIVASSSEIERRIQAFMNRKQTEVDEANCREFCNTINLSKQENSCARTNSVFIPRNGTKSHVKVSQVAHAYGPQTRPHLIRAENSMIANRSPRKRDQNEGLEERLQNMEKFLKLGRGQTVPGDVYQRLKTLEERILQLESLSPEYFSISPSTFKRQRLSQSNSTDLEEINSRIKQLEDSLRKKKVIEDKSPSQKGAAPTEDKSPP